jgi:S-formylglutathione hydrolase FrmB
MDECALSRRRFLQLAAAGLIASGFSACAATPTLPSARTTTTPSPASTPAAAPPRVALSVGSFVSTFRPAEATHWTVATPVLPGGAGTFPGAGTRYPVALFLHGLHGNNRTIFDTLQAQDVLQRHLAAGGTPFALASVDGGDWWWHRRSNGIDPQKMLLEEFLPLLQQRGLDTGRTALLGLSMGGFGALLLASQRKLPGLRAVAAMSPAIWDHFGVGIDGAFDNARDFAANDVFALRPNLANLPKRIDCGTEDELYPSVKDYVSGLNSPVEGGFQPGGHDAAYWRSILPDMVSFLGQHLG